MFIHPHPSVHGGRVREIRDSVPFGTIFNSSLTDKQRAALDHFAGILQEHKPRNLLEDRDLVDAILAENAAQTANKNQGLVGELRALLATKPDLWKRLQVAIKTSREAAEKTDLDPEPELEASPFAGMFS